MDSYIEEGAVAVYLLFIETVCVLAGEFFVGDRRVVPARTEVENAIWIGGIQFG